MSGGNHTTRRWGVLAVDVVTAFGRCQRLCNRSALFEGRPTLIYQVRRVFGSRPQSTSPAVLARPDPAGERTGYQRQARALVSRCRIVASESYTAEEAET